MQFSNYGYEMTKLNSKNTRLLIPTSISVLLIIVCIGLLKSQYKPNHEIAIAEQYIRFLSTNKIEDAYKLTDKSINLGITIEQFANNPDVKMLVNKKYAIKFNSCWPYQSYGNKIRRLILNRSIQSDNLYIDFSCNSILVTIVLIFKNGDWKISRSYSHSG